MDASKTGINCTAARTRLILDKPFLGALVLRLPMVEVTAECGVHTTKPNARKFIYNPAYIDALSLDETQFMLAHEALHCALSHFARCERRMKHRWDLAPDFAISTRCWMMGCPPHPEPASGQFPGHDRRIICC